MQVIYSDLDRLRAALTLARGAAQGAGITDVQLGEVLGRHPATIRNLLALDRQNRTALLTVTELARLFHALGLDLLSTLRDLRTADLHPRIHAAARPPLAWIPPDLAEQEAEAIRLALHAEATRTRGLLGQLPLRCGWTTHGTSRQAARRLQGDNQLAAQEMMELAAAMGLTARQLALRAIEAARAEGWAEAAEELQERALA